MLGRLAFLLNHVYMSQTNVNTSWDKREVQMCNLFHRWGLCHNYTYRRTLHTQWWETIWGHWLANIPTRPLRCWVDSTLFGLGPNRPSCISECSLRCITITYNTHYESTSRYRLWACKGVCSRRGCWTQPQSTHLTRGCVGMVQLERERQHLNCTTYTLLWGYTLFVLLSVRV